MGFLVQNLSESHKKPTMGSEWAQWAIASPSKTRTSSVRARYSGAQCPVKAHSGPIMGFDRVRIRILAVLVPACPWCPMVARTITLPWANHGHARTGMHQGCPHPERPHGAQYRNRLGLLLTIPVPWLPIQILSGIRAGAQSQAQSGHYHVWSRINTLRVYCMDRPKVPESNVWCILVFVCLVSNRWIVEAQELPQLNINAMVLVSMQYRILGLLWTWGLFWTDFAKMFSDALKILVKKNGCCKPETLIFCADHLKSKSVQSSPGLRYILKA